MALTSYVWADWTERLERLRAALHIATENPPTVERDRAAPWLAHRLGWPRTGSVTVVWHSLVWQYIDPAEQAEIETLLDAAGARATGTAPLALVGMESAGQTTARSTLDVTLTTWPGGTRELLATTAGHGIPTTWINAHAAIGR